MLVSHLIDLVPIWLLFAGTLLVMVLFIEYAFRLGKSAKAKAKKAQTSQVRAIMGSVLLLTDIHYTRLHSAVMNRIPITIWVTLYLMAALSMIIMGYQAGLTGSRSPVATITLTVAFSAVIILITDLDRPIMSLFNVNDQLLVELSEYMETDMRSVH
jgi:hypothetical protein